MQKRSPQLEICFDLIGLDPEFPLAFDALFVQADDPIRFLHAHQCLEIGLCFSGSGIFMVGDKILPFGTGDVSFIAAGEVHLARSAPGTTSQWAWIYLDPLQLVNITGKERALLDSSSLSGSEFLNILHQGTAPEIVAAVERLVNELREAVPHRSYLRALTWELLVLMHRRNATTPHSTPRADDFTRIAPALQIISQHFAAPLRLPDLALACGLSEPSLRRLFQRTMGRSPRDYWLDVRLNMASALLQTTTRSVLQISQEVGFESLSSFNRLFQKRLGQSPREWRARQKAA